MGRFDFGLQEEIGCRCCALIIAWGHSSLYFGAGLNKQIHCERVVFEVVDGTASRPKAKKEQNEFE